MTVKIRKICIVLATALFVVCMACLAAVNAGAQSGSPVSLSSEGDSISRLSDDDFTAEESFTYTARVTFAEGQAAGIAFGIDDEGAFVLNIDRGANRTKLMYFSRTQTGWSAFVIKEDYYIGNALSTPEELERVGGHVAAKEQFFIKVKVTGGAEPNVKCYVDDILRFDYENAIPLSGDGYLYDGGGLGVNVYNASADFSEIYFGESDFTRYNELYRNQYHYSPFSGWNNDPNGLVFDGEYYHLYYQHQPFKKEWGDMYWGHARSEDLLHWENLPIALLPTDGNYMWSGSAIIDRNNVSGLFTSIEDEPDYDGSKNILIYYTVDGGPNQTQWLGYSLDGGISFKKEKMIIDGATVDDGKTFRDPKIFEIDDDDWGIIVGGGRLRFYHSTNLTDWTLSSETPIFAECPDVYKLPFEGGYKWVMNIGGIAYTVGDLTFTDGKIRFVDQFGVDLTDPDTSAAQVRVLDCDNANGSYATQTFYIDDDRSDFNGRIVGLSWFAGQPGYQSPMDEHIWLFGEQDVGTNTGSLADIRSIWNGGFTIPVEYSLKRAGDTIVLRQTPISLDDISETVSERENLGSEELNELLSSVSGNTLKITLTVRTEAQGFGLRFFEGGNEYTEAGYSAARGYYLDRTHTSAGGISIPDYNELYSTGAGEFVPADGEYDMVLLLDRGSAELFCEDYTQAFYANTFAGYYSDGLEFYTYENLPAVADIKIERISGVFSENSGESALTLSADAIVLDTDITDSVEVFAFYTGSAGGIEWTCDAEGTVSVAPTENGAVISAVAAGSATVTATLKDAEGVVLDVKSISVTVQAGAPDVSDVDFTSDGVIAGEWHSGAEGITGAMNGDGFILAEGSYKNFAFGATVNVAEAGAAAVIFRAADDMSSYYIANYDRAAGVCKLWSEKTEFINVRKGPFDEVTLLVRSDGNAFEFYFNGDLIGSFTDPAAPASGRLGLNVFKGRAVFSEVTYSELHGSEYQYSGEDLDIYLSTENFVTAVYNFTLANSPVNDMFYTLSGNVLTLSSAYLNTLGEGRYVFTIVGESITESIAVTVNGKPFSVPDMNISSDEDAVIDIGDRAVVSVSIGGVVLPAEGYSVSDGKLTVYAAAFSEGANTVEVAFEEEENVTFTVTVSSASGIQNVVLDEIRDVTVPITGSVSGVSLTGITLTEGQYTVESGQLTISAEVIQGGMNLVIVTFEGGETVLFTITAPQTSAPPEDPGAQNPGGPGWGDILFYIVGSIEVVLIVTVVVMTVVKRHKEKRG